MLKLDSYLTLDLDAIKSPNLCDRFSSADLSRIGEYVWDGYSRDKASRKAWELRTEAAMDLALQIQADKNFPWPNCSNVAFPLITIAVLQFHARAYPAIIPGTQVVNCRVIGDDATGAKTIRARRVSTHMSYQVMEEDVSWEEQHDRLLINFSVVGCAFIKSYRDGDKGRNVSELVTARDLVLNYWAKSTEECERKTHVIRMGRNKLYTRVMKGVFRDVLEEGWYKAGGTPSPTPESARSDVRTGTSTPQGDETTPLTLLEQHCCLDLDDDGYAEPYIVTIDSDSRAVLRIVTRFDREEDVTRVKSGPKRGKIISIDPMEYFTKYPFIPSPDGGIYDIGFGVLTGPLNESVNTLVNQIIDAGTMSNAGGGFLGRGAKIRGGNYTFSPFEWKRVDAAGDDLHKSIVPLTVREPSGVLFNLLSLLINYTNRITGANDMMVGENPGQNTPAETTRTLVEQGAKIYTAIFKRVWRSMREEFRKLYLLNGIFMPEKSGFGSVGDFVLREDYLGDSSAIVPVADPRVASEQERMTQAITLKQAAASTPGYNPAEVEKRFLQALHVEGIEAVYPGVEKFPPPGDPKVALEQMKTEREKLKLTAAQYEFLMELEETKRLNDALIIDLHAKAAKSLAEADGVKSAREIAALQAAVGAIKVRNESIDRQRKIVLESMKEGISHDTVKRAAEPEGAGGLPNGGRMEGLERSSGNTGLLGRHSPMAGGVA